MCTVKKPKADSATTTKPLRILLPRNYLDDTGSVQNTPTVSGVAPEGIRGSGDSSGLQLGIQQLL